MNVFTATVCLTFGVAMVTGLMNSMNGMNSLNNFNGLNMNGLNGMNGFNMNNMNSLNSMNGLNNMNNWNGLNMNGMNNNWNMNAWNGMREMNGMGLLGGMVNMNSFNGLNTNMRNINGGRDDRKLLSEGIYDDATSVSRVKNFVPEVTPVLFSHSGDLSFSTMTPAIDNLHVIPTSADDPSEGHLVFAHTDISSMPRMDV